MKDDLLVAKLKREWGVAHPLMIAVPLKPLLHFVGLSFKSVGTLQTLAMLMDDGETVLKDADRTERMLNYYLDDLVG